MFGTISGLARSLKVVLGHFQDPETGAANLEMAAPFQGASQIETVSSLSRAFLRWPRTFSRSML